LVVPGRRAAFETRTGLSDADFASRSNLPTLKKIDLQTDGLRRFYALSLWPSWRLARNEFADCALFVTGGLSHLCRGRAP
jgi:hypothetical protein